MKSQFMIAGIIIAFLLPGCSSPPNENPRSHTVEIRGMKFQPSEISVNKGDTVVFINNDMVPHDVTEENNKKWTSSTLAVGQSFQLIVEESAGYYCTIHPVMKGKISLEE